MQNSLFHPKPIVLVRAVFAATGLIDFIGTLGDQPIGLIHYVEDVGLDDRYGLPFPSCNSSVTCFSQTALPLLALFPISLLRAAGGQPRILCGIGVLLLNLGFLYYGTRFVFHRSSTAARRLLVASIIYLPSLFALMSLLGGS